MKSLECYLTTVISSYIFISWYNELLIYFCIHLLLWIFTLFPHKSVVKNLHHSIVNVVSCLVLSHLVSSFSADCLSSPVCSGHYFVKFIKVCLSLFTSVVILTYNVSTVQCCCFCTGTGSGKTVKVDFCLHDCLV